MASSDDMPDLPVYLRTERTHLRLPSRPHWIEAIVEHLRHKAVLAGACHESRAGKLMIALHEALSNAIIHGNLELSSALKEQGDDAFARELVVRAADARLAGRMVDVVVEVDDQLARWTITDEGPGFDARAVLQRLQSDDPEVLLASGRGILLMKSFLDDVRYELGGRRLVLTMLRHTGAEKRQEPRVPVQQPVRIAPIHADGSVDWDAAYEAVSRDFSETGVGLLQRRLADSERVLIGFMTGERMHYVAADVRHCRALAGDTVEIGCRFVGARTSDASAAGDDVQAAMAALIAKQQTAQLAGDDRRCHRRVAYTERIELFTSPAAPPLAGFARDLSKGGIAFIVQTPLPPQVTLALPARDGSPPLRVQARIIRCNKIMDGFYDAGAEFLHLEQERSETS